MALLEFKKIDFLLTARLSLLPKLNLASIFMKTDKLLIVQIKFRNFKFLYLLRSMFLNPNRLIVLEYANNSFLSKIQK